MFQRDDWCCHLCGEDIDRDVVAPAPLAPTLDHVVPIARGGAHTMINLRAAHFRCNSAKGSRLTWAPAA
ncbi:HNH endonuclease [Streptomyces albipurpureus]|uniref:HNH endonuclease n=1 Tax=Streptomyces albipurpureus TaxID=2897419 RepID=UPI003CE4C166